MKLPKPNISLKPQKTGGIQPPKSDLKTPQGPRIPKSTINTDTKGIRGLVQGSKKDITGKASQIKDPGMKKEAVNVARSVKSSYNVLDQRKKIDTMANTGLNKAQKILEDFKKGDLVDENGNKVTKKSKAIEMALSGNPHLSKSLNTLNTLNMLIKAVDRYKKGDSPLKTPKGDFKVDPNKLYQDAVKERVKQKIDTAKKKEARSQEDKDVVLTRKNEKKPSKLPGVLKDTSVPGYSKIKEVNLEENPYSKEPTDVSAKLTIPAPSAKQTEYERKKESIKNRRAAGPEKRKDMKSSKIKMEREQERERAVSSLMSNTAGDYPAKPIYNKGGLLPKDKQKDIEHFSREYHGDMGKDTTIHNYPGGSKIISSLEQKITKLHPEKNKEEHEDITNTLKVLKDKSDPNHALASLAIADHFKNDGKMEEIPTISKITKEHNENTKSDLYNKSKESPFTNVFAEGVEPISTSINIGDTQKKSGFYKKAKDTLNTILNDPATLSKIHTAVNTGHDPLMYLSQDQKRSIAPFIHQDYMNRHNDRFANHKQAKRWSSVSATGGTTTEGWKKLLSDNIEGNIIPTDDEKLNGMLSDIFSSHKGFKKENIKEMDAPYYHKSLEHLKNTMGKYTPEDEKSKSALLDKINSYVTGGQRGVQVKNQKVDPELAHGGMKSVSNAEASGFGVGQDIEKQNIKRSLVPMRDITTTTGRGQDAITLYDPNKIRNIESGYNSFGTPLVKEKNKQGEYDLVPMGADTLKGHLKNPESINESIVKRMNGIKKWKYKQIENIEKDDSIQDKDGKIKQLEKYVTTNLEDLQSIIDYNEANNGKSIRIPSPASFVTHRAQSDGPDKFIRPTLVWQYNGEGSDPFVHGATRGSEDFETTAKFHGLYGKSPSDLYGGTQNVRSFVYQNVDKPLSNIIKMGKEQGIPEQDIKDQYSKYTQSAGDENKLRIINHITGKNYENIQDILSPENKQDLRNVIANIGDKKHAFETEHFKNMGSMLDPQKIEEHVNNISKDQGKLSKLSSYISDNFGHTNFNPEDFSDISKDPSESGAMSEIANHFGHMYKKDPALSKAFNKYKELTYIYNTLPKDSEKKYSLKSKMDEIKASISKTIKNMIPSMSKEIESKYDEPAIDKNLIYSSLYNDLTNNMHEGALNQHKQDYIENIDSLRDIKNMGKVEGYNHPTNARNFIKKAATKETKQQQKDFVNRYIREALPFLSTSDIGQMTKIIDKYGVNTKQTSTNKLKGNGLTQAMLHLFNEHPESAKMLQNYADNLSYESGHPHSFYGNDELHPTFGAHYKKTGQLHPDFAADVIKELTSYAPIRSDISNNNKYQLDTTKMPKMDKIPGISDIIQNTVGSYLKNVVNNKYKEKILNNINKLDETGISANIANTVNSLLDGPPDSLKNNKEFMDTYNNKIVPELYGIIEKANSIKNEKEKRNLFEKDLLNYYMENIHPLMPSRLNSYIMGELGVGKKEKDI